MEPAISLIIPCYNEAEAIERTIRTVLSTYALDCAPRIYVIDAGSRTDGTEKIVAHLSDQQRSGTISYVHLDRPSRGGQLIQGAKLATTPYLLFLHADTLLPKGWDAAIVDFFFTNADSAPLLGCFELSLPPPLTWSLRIMVWTANIRAKVMKLPYGDQAYFVRRSEYEAIGGFADIPLMEDVTLLRRYKEAHSRQLQQRQNRTSSKKKDEWSPFGFSLLFPPPCIRVLPMAVVTSPRRWNRKGVWWNTLCNQFYMLAWMAGVSPETIYQWYYGKTFKVDRTVRTKSA